jgi:hypothetical protein
MRGGWLRDGPARERRFFLLLRRHNAACLHSTGPHRAPSSIGASPEGDCGCCRATVRCRDVEKMAHGRKERGSTLMRGGRSDAVLITALFSTLEAVEQLEKSSRCCLRKLVRLEKVIMQDLGRRKGR